MGFSNNLSGATLTVAIPLGLLASVVLWGFFERRPGSTFGAISRVGGSRPEAETGDAGVEGAGSNGERPAG